jgi:hypothetical protein
VTLAQVAAAQGADDYVAAALAHQNVSGTADGQTSTQALSGVASDGRPLDSLLEQPALEVDTLTAGGMDPSAAQVIGGAHLARIIATQIADAARVATGVATVGHRGAHGYIRMLSAPSCSRCVVLAGKFYKTNQGFRRHPLCDCVHIPAAENLHSALTSPRAYFDSLDPAEQNRVFTTAGAQAIRDGADVGQVVNARRGAAGLSTAGARVSAEEAARLRAGRKIGRLQRVDVFGQKVFVTRTGATRGKPRLMPESIYEIAKDRAEAVRLLRLHGYIL